MFKNDLATHPAIYADIVNNYKFKEGVSFGDMETEIDRIYREKVEKYGLAEQGYYNDDEIVSNKTIEKREAFKHRLQSSGRLPKPDKK